MKKTTLKLIFLVALTSCQTLEIAAKKDDCSNLDWFEIGRSDGVQGLNSLSWGSKEKECNNFNEAHHQGYVNGWYAGVDDFCSESHGFAFGKSGHEYNNVCPESKEPDFVAAYRKGIKVYNHNLTIKNITDELNVLNEQATKSKPQAVPSVLKRINELQSKLEFNRSVITEINREMEDPTPRNSTL
jgi:cell fate (sporulation/competence/biofilm development) regulator YmcA (YheA/YmcA/DUF963 family)